MCGIAGAIKFDSTPVSITELAMANGLQLKRGPDSDGIYQLANMALAHRRLKIFDLSDNAAQPMVDHQLGLALVFNGAVYNFKELRKELEGKGYSFTSGSDTEVIMKAFHAWGDDCVQRFDGMFAFAIWERDKGELTVVRDRLGIKPLYYGHNGKGFCFASTLPAMLKFGGIDTSLDAAALQYYLTFHAVPEPFTLLKGVKKLSPGCMLKVGKTGKITEKRYWQLKVSDNNADKNIPESEWMAKTNDSLQNAMNQMMCADVPVGILLSGGLDSSLIVAMAAKAASSVETFSIGFESSGGEKGDEFYYSDMVAKHYGTKHHKIYFSNRELLDSLEDCVASMSEPMTSHDNIGFYLLSQEVAKYVKVVLSGQGADEVFGGYNVFQKMAQKPEGINDVDFYAQNFFDMSYDEYRDTVNENWRTGSLSREFVEKEFLVNNSNLVDNSLYLDTTFALANGPLLRVDNQTMSASLEARVPFLDHHVVELAASIPQEYKLSDNGKGILKKLGREILPREVVDRPKGYFPVPILKYIEGPALELMQELLSEKRVKERGIFRPEKIKQLLHSPRENITPLGGSKLWQIGLLEYWLELNGL